MMKGKAGKVIRQLTRSNTNVAASVASKVKFIIHLSPVLLLIYSLSLLQMEQALDTSKKCT